MRKSQKFLGLAKMHLGDPWLKAKCTKQWWREGSSRCKENYHHGPACRVGVSLINDTREMNFLMETQHKIVDIFFSLPQMTDVQSGGGIILPSRWKTGGGSPICTATESIKYLSSVEGKVQAQHEVLKGSFNNTCHCFNIQYWKKWIPA